jgi:tricorn protease
MRHGCLLLVALILVLAAEEALADKTKLIRYPDYHDGALAFCYLGEIWLLEKGKEDPRPLTAHEASDVYPKFSPDGKWIAFSSSRSGNYDVYVIPANGGKPKRLTRHSAADYVVTWTPDSKYVVFRSSRDREYRSSLYKVSLEAELPEKMPCGTAYNASFSPSGRFIALNRHYPSYDRRGYRGSNNADVWLFDSQEGKFNRLTDFDGHDGSPMISGKDIYFVSDRDGTFNIWKIPMEGGEAVQVTKHKDQGVQYPSISPDRQTIVYERDFELYKLDVKSGEYSTIDLRLRTDYIENPVE